MLIIKTKGFTIIELLVTLVITTFIIASLISIYLTSAQKSHQALEAERLDQALQASLTLMSNDIRRAGFWANAKSDAGSGANTNPFMSNDVSINAGGDCILLAYDRDGDGSLPSVGVGSDDERYGFRLMNNAIQARPSGESYDCDAAASSWENITDPNIINISQLNFVASDKTIDIDGSGAGTSTIKIRTITITVTGSLVSDASVTRTLSEQVRIRNDKYQP